VSVTNVQQVCDAYMRTQIRVYPQHTNRSSLIGDDCLRRLVYYRTNWEDIEPHEVGLQYIFRQGNLLEEPTVRLLQDSGYKVSRAQEPFLYKSGGKVLLSGHIDGVIEHPADPGWYAVLEIKTMSPHIWDRTDTAEDMERHPWSRKYRPQLNMYCFGLEIPNGLWVLVNKATGRVKSIPHELDYDLAEETLRRCETINDHVDAGTLPDQLAPTHQNSKICSDCCFQHICNPSITRESMQLIVDDELLVDIDEMQSLKPTRDRYEELKKALKARLDDEVGKKRMAIGRWMYDGSRKIWDSRWELMEEKNV